MSLRYVIWKKRSGYRTWLKFWRQKWVREQGTFTQEQHDWVMVTSEIDTVISARRSNVEKHFSADLWAALERSLETSLTPPQVHTMCENAMLWVNELGTKIPTRILRRLDQVMGDVFESLTMPNNPDWTGAVTGPHQYREMIHDLIEELRKHHDDSESYVVGELNPSFLNSITLTYREGRSALVLPLNLSIAGRSATISHITATVRHEKTRFFTGYNSISLINDNSLMVKERASYGLSLARANNPLNLSTEPGQPLKSTVVARSDWLGDAEFEIDERRYLSRMETDVSSAEEILKKRLLYHQEGVFKFWRPGRYHLELRLRSADPINPRKAEFEFCLSDQESDRLVGDFDNVEQWYTSLAAADFGPFRDEISWETIEVAVTPR